MADWNWWPRFHDPSLRLSLREQVALHWDANLRMLRDWRACWTFVWISLLPVPLLFLLPALAMLRWDGRSAAAPALAANEDAGLVAIESPMVGTFYASLGPDKPPFVAVGAQLGPDSVVCLVEAMKIFNEIKAERSGTVAKVLVQSGQAVEFGQPLFMIKPS